MDAPDAGQRYAHLDGLRGLAALSVLLCHFVLAFQPALLSGDPAQGVFAASLGLAQTPAILLWSPDFGVAVFFALSGFVLSASSSRPAAAGALPRLAAQLLRRWIRLAGPVLGSCLLIWAVLETGLVYNRQAAAVRGLDWIGGQYAGVSLGPASLLDLLRQALVGVFVFEPQWWNLALWTMPIEFAGSIAIFVFYAAVKGADRKVRTALLACAAAALCATSYAGFALGALLWEAEAMRRRSGRAAWVGGGCALALAVVLGGMPFLALGTAYGPGFVLASAYLDDPQLAAHRAGAILMAAAAVWFPPLRRLLQARLPQALGRVSFMVYLCHIIVLCSLASWIVLRLSPVVGYDLATLAALIATLAVLFPLAAGMTRLVDAPSIRLSRQAERLALAALAAGPSLWRKAAVP